ncbi:MAG: hypothetical protein QME32_06130, partial [Endomicrobiia bacterium]|nr:hypothetical protein [Endomicrobiia bacterium]
EGSGKIRLEWSAPADSDGRSVFSYVIKYATFSVAELGGNTTAWWNHPATITAVEEGLPSKYGRSAVAPTGSAETIKVSGLAPGEYYYFGVKIIDRYNRDSDWDTPYRAVAIQARAFATTPPWTPSKITDLIGIPLEQVAKVRLEWTVPEFINELSQFLPGHIKQPGEYCIQYSTTAPPDPVNTPNQSNNWASSQKVFVSTKDVRTGDLQNYVLTGLSHNTTYYIHIFTRNEWPNKWSYASHPVTTVNPYIYLKPVENLAAVPSASADDDIASYVTLSWDNPADEQFLAGARVAYSTSAYPSSPDGGNYFDVEPLSSGSATDYAHIRLLPRHNYYYSVWAYDASRFYSEPRNVQTFTAPDMTPPTGVENVTSLVVLSRGADDDSLCVRLSWNAPASPLYRNIDFDKVKIYFSSSSADPATHEYLAATESGITSFTHDGALPYATYYYSFASMDTVGNEQAAVKRSTHAVYVSESYVPTSPPTIITHLYSASRDYADGCKVALTWRAPSEPHFRRIVARVGYDAYPLSVSEGDFLREWIASPSAEGSDEFKRLVSMTTNYISLFAVSQYAVTSRPAKLPVYANVPWTDTTAPHVPRDARVSSSRKISWGAVKYDANLAVIPDYLTPRTDQLYFYEILTATSMKGPWSVSGRVAPPVTWYAIPSGSTGYIKIRAADASGNYADSVAVDTSGNIYVAAEDASFVMVPVELLSSARAASNPSKDSHILTLSRVPAEEKGIIYKSVEFKAAKISETADAMMLSDAPDFSLGGPGARLAFSYEIENPEASFSSPSSRERSAEPVLAIVTEMGLERELGVFYFNGVEWQRINLASASSGYVFAAARFAGKYHLRRAPAVGEFTFYDAIPRIITPNGDGKNDRAMFRFTNPAGLKVSLKIYDINSTLVRDAGETTGTSDIQGEHIFWDGLDDNSRAVAPGVYVYQLELEGKTINGTIVVAR